MLTTTLDDVGKPIRDQWSGYWLRPSDGVPAAPPGYRPTGAVLPQPGANIAGEILCLDLVSVSYEWLVLSESGLYTYSHSEGLLRNEQGWRFVTWRDGKPLLFTVSYSEKDLLDPAHVRSLYGSEAAGHCRPDRRAVQLRLKLQAQRA